MGPAFVGAVGGMLGADVTRRRCLRTSLRKTKLKCALPKAAPSMLNRGRARGAQNINSAGNIEGAVEDKHRGPEATKLV